MATDLEIRPDQTFWTEHQKVALQHLGVEGAHNADLAVFFHYASRTGLDPFARQLYMIRRDGKWTIQTGIDGFRLVGRRAADDRGETLSITPTEWCGKDGVWRDVWLDDVPPAAARVAVIRNGQPFPALAMFSEYAARTRDGALTSMWKRMPAGQLAKCAEALAWRKAFPQDLSGLYTADEMEQAGPAAGMPPAGGPPPAPAPSLADRARSKAQAAKPAEARTEPPAVPAQPEREQVVDTDTGEIRDGSDDDVVDAELVEDEPPPADLDAAPPAKITAGTRARLFGLCRAVGLTKDEERLGWANTKLDRTIESFNDLTEDEADELRAALEKAKASLKSSPAAPADEPA